MQRTVSDANLSFFDDLPDPLRLFIMFNISEWQSMLRLTGTTRRMRQLRQTPQFQLLYSNAFPLQPLSWEYLIYPERRLRSWLQKPWFLLSNVSRRHFDLTNPPVGANPGDYPHRRGTTCLPEYELTVDEWIEEGQPPLSLTQNISILTAEEQQSPEELGPTPTSTDGDTISDYVPGSIASPSTGGGLLTALAAAMDSDDDWDGIDLEVIDKAVEEHLAAIKSDSPTHLPDDEDKWNDIDLDLIDKAVEDHAMKKRRSML